MIKAIGQFIEDNTTFVVGTTLQVGWRPTTAPDQCTLIAESGGAATYPELIDREDKMIQALSRATTYNTARLDAYIIYNFLHGSAGWELPEVVVGEKFFANMIEAISAPQYLGQDAKGRYEFSTNYIFRIQDRE